MVSIQLRNWLTRVYMAGVLMLQLEVPQETMPINVQPFPLWYTRGPPESPCREDSCLVLLAHAPNWSLPPGPLCIARCCSLNIWLHKCKTPCTLLLHLLCDPMGAQQDPAYPLPPPPTLCSRSSAPYLAGGGTSPTGADHGAGDAVAPVLHALALGDQGHGHLLQDCCQGLG